MSIVEINEDDDDGEAAAALLPSSSAVSAPRIVVAADHAGGGVRKLKLNVHRHGQALAADDDDPAADDMPKLKKVKTVLGI